MGIGPVPAVAKALDVAEVALKDVDLIELNQAFPAQVLACTREWGFAESDFERTNVHGLGRCSGSAGAPGPGRPPRSGRPGRPRSAHGARGRGDGVGLRPRRVRSRWVRWWGCRGGGQ
ncbi:hypothetical protein GCM10009836_25460 [Pseudonocardia ailaonensis]|uniref:Thiolase C-terminal domain-containing protein n=1 Tax=Pseudonocardia ailaonensis TaxID=367279 RepID=A0ABN2N088_9PSEU